MSGPAAAGAGRGTVGLPQTDAGGLSENWLFKHAGDRHWRRLCAALGASGVRSERLRDAVGRPLCPTFVAVRGRYERPLAAVDLDDPLTTRAALSRYGRSFFRSRVTVSAGGARFRLEMLTSFAARSADGGNALEAAVPASPAPRSGERGPRSDEGGPRGGGWGPVRALRRPPELLLTGQALRRGEAPAIELAGRLLRPSAAGRGRGTLYEPSPYSDYNGAGLLYFAAFPTIADTVERRLLAAGGQWNGAGDWSRLASTVARDVFYYSNLDLGRPLRVELRAFERGAHLVLTHLRFTEETGRRALADVLTAKRLLA